MKDGPSITESVDAAIERLAIGELVALPTETVYGLAADATNPDAVAKVFRLKGRPADHPLIIHCSSAEQAWRCGSYVTEPARLLAEKFWPGPLTIVISKADWIDSIVTGGQDSVAVRVPAHPVTRQLLQQFNRPVVAPSANRFGKVSPTRARHVKEEFMGSDLLILDGGNCAVGIESTIVDCRHAEDYRVLRPGKITDLDIEKEFEACAVNACLRESDIPSHEKIRVSGCLPSHYAPTARVKLIESDQMDRLTKQLQEAQESTFVICNRPCPSQLPNQIRWHNIGSDAETLAKNLYALLREADEAGCQTVIVQLPTNEGIGTAIRDRLQRAAAD